MLADYSDYETALMNEFGAPPPTEPHTGYPISAKNGLGTLPPRDNGRNIDVTQLTAGSLLRFPLFVEGGLFSTGDAHFSGRQRVLHGHRNWGDTHLSLQGAEGYRYVAGCASPSSFCQQA